MKIKIYKQCLEDSHTIYLNDKKRERILVDRCESNFDVDRFKFLVLNMVSNWPKLLEDKSIYDGLTYVVSIKEDNKDEERIYEFKNKFPPDIYKLHNLVDELCEGLKYGR